MDILENLKRGLAFLAEKPLEFLRDPETGRAVMVWYSSLHTAGMTIDTPMAVILTPGVARALLADLQALRSLLEEVTKGPTTPDVVQ